MIMPCANQSTLTNRIFAESSHIYNKLLFNWLQLVIWSSNFPNLSFWPDYCNSFFILSLRKIYTYSARYLGIVFNSIMSLIGCVKGICKLSYMHIVTYTQLGAMPTTISLGNALLSNCLYTETHFLLLCQFAEALKNSEFLGYSHNLYIKISAHNTCNSFLFSK